MTREELLFRVRTDSFKDLVAISEIDSEETLAKLKESDHQVGYTKETFLKDHPTLDPSKLFSAPSLTTPCYYFDEETIVIFPIFLFGTELLGGGKVVPSLEALIERGVKTISEDIQAQNFAYMMTSLSDLMRIEYFVKLFQKGILENPYMLFRDVYVYGEYGCTNFGRETIEKVVGAKTEEQKEQTLKDLSGMPEEITIYRGMAERSASENEAYSWTTNPAIALFFSVWHAEKNARVCSAKVKKKDVIEYLDDRNEDEILVMPENVYDKSTMDFYGVDWTKHALANVVEKFHSVKDAARYDKLPFERDSHIHNKAHAIRVLLHCLILADEEGLNEEDTHILTEAALYHDVGRLTDERCRKHGTRSAKAYKRAVKNANPITLFLMKYHCKPDEEGYDMIERDPELSKEKDRVTLLFNIFKDADVLDRVRLGLHSLDYTQLRTETAKRMPFVARMTLEQLEV